tara:strand:- start:182 stop:493 length:312 start_codon:yes stop_codon:yes gene_type:complete
MNDYILNDYATSLAEEIKTDIEKFDNCDAMTLAWEAADSSEHVIYYYKAHHICQNCDITHGENFMEECYNDTFKSYDDTAVTIAFGELHYRILSKLSDLGVEV